MVAVVVLEKEILPYASLFKSPDRTRAVKDATAASHLRFQGATLFHFHYTGVTIQERDSPAPRSTQKTARRNAIDFGVAKMLDRKAQVWYDASRHEQANR